MGWVVGGGGGGRGGGAVVGVALSVVSGGGGGGSGEGGGVAVLLAVGLRVAPVTAPSRPSRVNPTPRHPTPERRSSVQIRTVCPTLALRSTSYQISSTSVIS